MHRINEDSLPFFIVSLSSNCRQQVLLQHGQWRKQLADPGRQGWGNHSHFLKIICQILLNIFQWALQLTILNRYSINYFLIWFLLPILSSTGRGSVCGGPQRRSGRTQPASSDQVFWAVIFPCAFAVENICFCNSHHLFVKSIPTFSFSFFTQLRSDRADQHLRPLLRRTRLSS